jgi:outer membrane lipoprotein-sorting protein
MKQTNNLIITFFLLMATQTYAQNDFFPMASAESFQEELKKESARLTGIESNFTQTKYIGLLSEKIVSSGKFYYHQPDKICMDYASPVKYLMVINGHTIKITSDGKSNVYDLNANQMTSRMQLLISACMTGNLENLDSGYERSFKENHTLYWVQLLPPESMKTYLKSIDIYLDKSDVSVHRLKITETSGDYTEYVFTGQIKNAAIPDAKFNIH